MPEIPESDALKAIDKEAFSAMCKDPAKLAAHLDAMLLAVHNRMMAPFQEKPAVSYHQFPKSPLLDMTKLVSMPGMGKKPEPAATTAQPADAARVQPVPPERTHSPTTKPEKTPPFSMPKGTVIHQFDVDPRRGVVQDDLPDMPVSAPLHTENVVSEPLPKSKEIHPVLAVETPVSPELKTPPKADPDAVKKRFEERQAGLDKLFKDKGSIT